MCCLPGTNSSLNFGTALDNCNYRKDQCQMSAAKMQLLFCEFAAVVEVNVERTSSGTWGPHDVFVIVLSRGGVPAAINAILTGVCCSR